LCRPIKRLSYKIHDPFNKPYIQAYPVLLLLIYMFTWKIIPVII